MPDGEPKQGLHRLDPEDCGSGTNWRLQAYIVIELDLLHYRQGAGQPTLKNFGELD